MNLDQLPRNYAAAVQADADALPVTIPCTGCSHDLEPHEFCPHPNPLCPRCCTDGGHHWQPSEPEHSGDHW